MRTRLSQSGKRHGDETPVSRFSRQWFMQGLRTFVWVAVISILTWVYADIHFTAEKDVLATMHLYTGSADNIVLLSPNDTSIRFRIKGKRNSIDRFMDRLSVQKSVLLYDPARALGPGQHRERIAEILTDLPELRDSGLEIVWARPRDIDIWLDKLIDIRSVLVKPDFSGVVLAESAKVKPERVSLRIPASQMKNLGLEKQLAVLTKPITLGDEAVVGKTRTVEVELLPPPNVSHARLVPRKVAVTFKVGQRTGSRKFAVTVAVQSPKAWLMDETWNRYKLQAKPPEDWSRQITVTGNRIDLEKLSAEKIRAYIVLTDEDKKRKLESWWPGKVKVRFPPGLNIRLSEPAGDLLYRLVKRSESPAPPP